MALGEKQHNINIGKSGAERRKRGRVGINSLPEWAKSIRGRGKVHRRRGREKGIYSRCFFSLSLLGGREMRESAVCRFFPVYASGVDVPPLAI